MRRALVALSILLCPVAASAWTDAVVRSVHAEARVQPDASVHVTLTATVRVHGGWLEGLEIAGLDDDLVLDEAYEVWAEDGEGVTYAPRVRAVRGNRVQVSFRGRSPRRGELRIGFAYRASLAHHATEPLEDEERVRVTWSLPGWQAGLDGVQIDLIVPPGSRAGPRDDQIDTGAELSVDVEDLADRTVVHCWRAHLPRTVPWTVSADVPAAAMDAALRGAPVVRLPPPPPSAVIAPERDGTPFWMGLASLLGLLALAQILVVPRRARQVGVRVRALLLAPPLVRAAIALVAAPLGAWLGLIGHPMFALATLALVPLAATHLPRPQLAPSKLGAWRNVDARWLRAARGSFWRRWLHPASLLDATTAPGLLHAAVWLALPWVWTEPPVSFDVLLLASVLPLPILATGTRLAFVRPAHETLHRLLAHARSLRGLPDGVALRPVMHVSVDGDVQEARVRTVLEARADGLLRLDLALGHLPHAGGWHTRPVWLVVTRADSPADTALAALGFEAEPSRGGRRVCRSVPTHDAALLRQVLDALAACPPARASARGTAAPLETVRDLPAPQAVGF